jgi:hypothetical protein
MKSATQQTMTKEQNAGNKKIFVLYEHISISRRYFIFCKTILVKTGKKSVQLFH